MTNTSKIFLAFSITALAVSLTDAGSNVGWGILRPLSAVSFIMFFITNLIAREVALYDAEERAKRKPAESQPDPSRPDPRPSSASRLSPA